MIRARVLPTAALCALLALALPDRWSAAQETSEIRVGQPTTVTVPSGTRVDVYGGNGYILLKKGTSAHVVVSTVKSKLAADVPVTMVKTPEAIVVCAIYPASNPKKPHECVAGGRARVYDGNPQKLPEIGITVELPEGMAAAASIGAGEVRATAVAGEAVLYSDRGTVRVNDGGVGDIRASVGMLGTIEAVLTHGSRRREVRLNSPGSGRVRVVMPRDLSVRYVIATQLPPRIDPAFGITGRKGSLVGSTSSQATEVDLNVDTGIAGEFVLQRPAR